MENVSVATRCAPLNTPKLPESIICAGEELFSVACTLSMANSVASSATVENSTKRKDFTGMLLNLRSTRTWKLFRRQWTRCLFLPSVCKVRLSDIQAGVARAGRRTGPDHAGAND